MKVVSISEKEKIKQELYEILEQLPKPPSQANLTSDQQFWWYWFGNMLVKTKKFANADLPHLQRAAYWLDTRCKAIKIQSIKNEKAGPDSMPGHVQVYSSGASNVSPYVTLIEKADKALNEISSHFGLSIRDRNKLSKPEEVDPGQTSLFDEFLNQKQM